MHTEDQLETKARKLAELMGDPYGFSDDTIDFVASEMQLNYDDVREILHTNDAMDLQMYYEHAADLDAQHYGQI